MLAQEPWCFHPGQIAMLTDWQIEHLYMRPALERANRLDRQRECRQRSRSASPREDGEPSREPPGCDSPELRAWVIEQFQAMGMSLKEAEEQFEEQGRNFNPSES